MVALVEEVVSGVGEAGDAVGDTAKKFGTASSDRYSRGELDMLLNQDPPVGWPKPHRSAVQVLSAAGFTLITLITVAVFVAAIVVADVTPALISAASAVMFAHLVGLSISSMRHPSPSTLPPRAGLTDQGERGLAFSYSRWVYYWLSSVLVTVVLFAVGFSVVFAQAGTAVAWAMALVLAAIALFIVWFLVVLLRLAPGVVVVSPTGIYHRSLLLDHFVPWDAIIDVQAREAPGPCIVVRRCRRTEPENIAILAGSVPSRGSSCRSWLSARNGSARTHYPPTEQ